MKKIFTILAFFILLAVFTAPVLAQMQQPNECCKARNSFTLKKAEGTTNDITINSGDFIGPDKTDNFCDADSDGDNDRSGLSNYKGSAEWGILCMLNTIFTITNWIFYFLMVMVTLMFIYGGFILLTAQGEPPKVSKGRGIITFAIIGLAVALLARIIPSVVRFIMGV